MEYLSENNLWDDIKHYLGFYRIGRAFKHAWQRLTRGWSDDETWNLDYRFCKWMLPRLKRFKKLANGYPSHLAPEEWDVILDKMIRACETVLYDDDISVIRFKGMFGDDKEAAVKRWKETDEGFELMGKYIRHLWW